MKRLFRSALLTFAQGLSTSLMYRGSLAIFVVSESLAYAGYIAFWYRASQSSTASTIYNGLELVGYFTLAAFHHTIQDHQTARDVGSDIRLGRLSYAMIRPYPYLLQATARSAATFVSRLALLTPIFLLVTAFIPGFYQMIATDFTIIGGIYYLVALFVAAASAILTRLVVGMLAFDMTQIWGPDTMLIALYFATSGSVFPIDIAPSWLQQIALWSPTFYMTGFPTLVFIGRVSPEQFANYLMHAGIVFVVLSGIATLMWQRGIKRFEAIGI
jgi:ABC-2 type transport system permease protein